MIAEFDPNNTIIAVDRSCAGPTKPDCFGYDNPLGPIGRGFDRSRAAILTDKMGDRRASNPTGDDGDLQQRLPQQACHPKGQYCAGQAKWRRFGWPEWCYRGAFPPSPDCSRWRASRNLTSVGTVWPLPQLVRRTRRLRQCRHHRKRCPEHSGGRCWRSATDPDIRAEWNRLAESAESCRSGLPDQARVQGYLYRWSPSRGSSHHQMRSCHPGACFRRQ